LIQERRQCLNFDGEFPFLSSRAGNRDRTADVFRLAGGQFGDSKEFTMKSTLKQFYASAIAIGLAAAPVAFVATPALAHGQGGMSGVHGDFGGQSSSHMNVNGRAHTNGPNATDRDFGVVHARTRMSAKGLRHSKALLHAHRVIDSDNDADDTLAPVRP
jgi:hypothetical protein